MKEEDYMRFETLWDLTHREVRGRLWMMVKGNEKGGSEVSQPHNFEILALAKNPPIWGLSYGWKKSKFYGSNIST